MKRAWWPSGIYEAWPWIAIACGSACASLAFAASSPARGEWTLLGVSGFLVGCGLVVYGGVVLQTRRDYRKRSKWHRENS